MYFKIRVYLYSYIINIKLIRVPGTIIKIYIKSFKLSIFVPFVDNKVPFHQ